MMEQTTLTLQSNQSVDVPLTPTTASLNPDELSRTNQLIGGMVSLVILILSLLLLLQMKP